MSDYIQLFKQLKSKWIIEEILDFELKGKPGRIEIHYGLNGNATVIKPMPDIRKPRDSLGGTV